MVFTVCVGDSGFFLLFVGLVADGGYVALDKVFGVLVSY